MDPFSGSVTFCLLITAQYEHLYSLYSADLRQSQSADFLELHFKQISVSVFNLTLLKPKILLLYFKKCHIANNDYRFLSVTNIAVLHSLLQMQAGGDSSYFNQLNTTTFTGQSPFCSAHIWPFSPYQQHFDVNRADTCVCVSFVPSDASWPSCIDDGSVLPFCKCALVRS